MSLIWFPVSSLIWIRWVKLLDRLTKLGLKLNKELIRDFTNFEIYDNISSDMFMLDLQSSLKEHSVKFIERRH